MEIKHILNEWGVKEVFRLEVPAGAFAGTYEIEKPDGWDDVDSKVDIDEELFFVKNFIIGDSEKLVFHQYSNKIAFDLLKGIYEEQKGDGIAMFKWLAVKNGVEYDLLTEQFAVDFNKYEKSFDTSMYKIEIEIRKSESQNKLFNREETTIDLFSEKDLDENDIDPVETFDIGYKKGDSLLSNFYFYNVDQRSYGNNASSVKFFAFTRADDYDFGTNTNNICGIENMGSSPFQVDRGPFVTTAITLKLVKIQFANFDVNCRTSGGNIYPNVRLVSVVKNGGTVVRTQELKTYTENLASPVHYSRIRIDFEEFDLNEPLQPGESLHFEVKDIGGGDFIMYGLNTSTSIEITTNIEAPLVRAKTIYIFDAINQIVKSCTASEMEAESMFFGENGIFHNTSISTGLFLRGLPSIYSNNNLKTSFKSIFSDGISKLLACGYDILNDKVIFEDIHYFFKDLKVYDLSDKQYLWDGFKIYNDTDSSFNTLLFGSTKISTKSKDDIMNFVTSAEFITPLKSVKNKFDKKTNLIIDEYKIRDLIEDQSSTTSENDDDLALIDLVDTKDFWDEGVFENCEHQNTNGNLWLNCLSMPFDTTMIEPHNFIQITQGINLGTWLVLEVTGSKLKLNKTSNIETGNLDTLIRYRVIRLIKNRTNEGFTNIQNVRNEISATNIRHNPKYHMARWFSYFGSGMRRKGNEEKLKVTNYKNNSIAEMKCNSTELANEISDLITVGADETLGRLRNYAQTFFNGDAIEISYQNVTFEEFFAIYQNWKFGIDGDRLQSRGYIPLNTPDGIFDAYPFGDGAFSHNRKTNVLSIKAKIKGKSVDNPTLLNVEQLDKNTVKFTWDFSEDYYNALSTIQYSFDGVVWQSLEEVSLLKEKTVQSSVFDSIFSGTTVYFRVIVSSADYSNKKSNTLPLTWQFNNWVVREINRSVDVACGYSYLNFEVYGRGDFEIEWNFISIPGGGNAKIIDSLGNTVMEFNSTDGSDYDETQTLNFSLDMESKYFYMQMIGTFNDGQNQLQCNYGNNLVITTAEMKIKITETVTSDEKTMNIKSRGVKRYYTPQTGPFIPSEPGTDPF